MQEALQGALRRPDHKAVRVTDAFWGGQLNKIHTVTVWDVINKFEHDQEKGILQNFEWVMQGKTGEHVGPPWYDGPYLRGDPRRQRHHCGNRRPKAH